MLKQLKKINPAWLVYALVLFFIWDTPVVLPLKLFVVFLHELSHALAALLTGGEVLEIVINSDQGGQANLLGGSRFITLTAGYLGSLIWGGLIMVLAARTDFDKALSFLIGLATLVITLVYVRNIFGFVFGIGFGVLLILSGLYLRGSINDLLLRIIGFTSCIYAVLDIKSDILDRPEVYSDARMLAELTYLPTLFWGGFWFLLATFLTVFFLCLSGSDSGSSGEQLAQPLSSNDQLKL